MAKISFANLSQDFSMWRDEVDNHATDKAADHFTTTTAGGHLVTLQGSGLTYQNGVPNYGTVDSIEIELGGAKTVADISITGIDTPFADFANIVAAPTTIERTMALWSAALAGDDEVDLGANVSARNLYLTFGADGYESRANAIGGNDAVRGDAGAGAIAGDFLIAAAGLSAFGGHDEIVLSKSASAFVTGDILLGQAGSIFFAGDDRIVLDQVGTAIGDAGTVYGVLSAGDDTITGGGDNDYLIGDVEYAVMGSSINYGDDVIHAGAGSDILRGDYYSSLSSSLRGGNDRLYGEAGDDYVYGDEGNDYLNGGTGSDSLVGGSGRDTIRGGDGNDTIEGGAGVDTADYGDKKAAISITLDDGGSANVRVAGALEEHLDGIENLIGGSGADKFVGFADYNANLFDGHGGNDTLDGAGGDDTLIGGAGNDRLTGGIGADQFRFDKNLGSTNIDRIVDFVHGLDEIALDDQIFTALGQVFDRGEFVARTIGHAASSASQHIIYDKSNGSLWYDSDGKGGHAAVQFAQLGTTASHPIDLSWGDFSIV